VDKQFWGSVGNLIFDLGGTYSLSDIAIWQYDAEDISNSEGRGVKDFTLESSTDGISFTALLGTTTLAIASEIIINGAAQISALGNTTASHVRLNYLNNHGNLTFTGLAEVQFVATALPELPEPSTIAMFGIGAGIMGLVSIRRRRREQKQATPA